MVRTLLLLLPFLAACAPTAAPVENTRPTDRRVVVHLFEWRWDDIAEECETHLAPAGFAAVQVSPVTENHVVEGRPWWERYQPVSYHVETRSGTRAAFAEMVSRCAAVGVDVYVDAILNHMADADLEHPTMRFTGLGTAGSTFGSFDYPGLYGYDDFNHCGLTPNDDIADWDDPDQAWNCELVDLADLDTGSDRVRARLGAFLADLASLGVSGIRIDAARHIPPDDIRAILDSAAWSGYVFQEVSLASWGSWYTATGAVTDFAFGPALSERLRSGPMAALLAPTPFWETPDHLPSDSAFVFVDNHDNQRGHGAGTGVLTFRDGPLYAMAQAMMLATPFGRPRVMSSYAFERDSQGPPADADERLLRVHGDGGTGCGTVRICEHRWPVIAGMVGFSNAVRGTDLRSVVSDGDDRLSFGRGDRGFVAFNRSDGAWEATLSTGLAEGTYCDVAAGVPAGDACAGGAISVDADGRAAFSVPPMGVQAIHVAAQPR